MVEVVARDNRLQALGDPLVEGDRGGHLRDQPLGLAHVGRVVRGGRVDLGVVMRQDAHRGPQDVHPVGRPREAAIQLDQRPGDRPRRPEAGVELVELRGGGQVAVEEQERGLLVRDGAGEVLDRIAPILEPAGALPPLDVGDRRLAGDDVLQARMIPFLRRRAHIGTPLKILGAIRDSPGKTTAGSADPRAIKARLRASGEPVRREGSGSSQPRGDRTSGGSARPRASGQGVGTWPSPAPGGVPASA